MKSHLKFTGYSVGLIATHDRYATRKLVRVEISETIDGMCIHAVSGHNLSTYPIPCKVITREEWDTRPACGVPQARWLLQKLGWRTGGKS